jgi:hypothetical protein
MNYFIKRDLNEYGPYSLSDLQKYVASGNILLTDLCRSDGLTDWVPVSQVIGNIPVPAAPQPAAPQPAAGTVYGAPAGAGAAAYGTQGGYAAPVGSQYPPPPNLHWALVLLFTFLTCGVFSMIWLIVETVWLKKVKPDSKGVRYLTITVALWILMIVLAVAEGVAVGSSGRLQPGLRGIVGLLDIGYIVFYLIAIFAMRSDIEDHFNTAEPVGLSLSGVMTFFFAVFYFQYHFTRINEMKQRQIMGYSG